MHSLIEAYYYHLDEIFHLEMDKLFKNTWQFIGFEEDLDYHQDYLCTSIGGKSVVIMNFSGEYKAFHNLCSHRLNKICLLDAGNGPLQCQYHGWTYNDQGFPYLIPNKRKFSDLDENKLKLTAYTVAKWGKFIFIKMKVDGPDLGRYLGDSQHLLTAFSDGLGRKIDKHELIIHANWKIVVENTLEDYHVRTVHPRSLSPLGIKESALSSAYPHSATHLKLDLTLNKNEKLNAAFDKRPVKIQDYLHQLIFPNLTLASTYGASFSIQQIIPLSPHKTKLISHLFSTSLEEPLEGESIILKHFNASAVDFNRRVFEEDKMICEHSHQGLMEAEDRRGILGDDELRIYEFQKAYLDYLQKTNKEQNLVSI